MNEHCEIYNTKRFIHCMYLGISPFFRSDREYSPASMRSLMLCRDLSSEPSMKMARAWAFLDNLSAKFIGNAGEFRALRICLYNESTLPLLLAKSSAVAQTIPFPISDLQITHPEQDISINYIETYIQTLGSTEKKEEVIS